MKKKILYTLCVFCTFALVLFLVLKNGISISNIQFDFLKLEQLYIKLDKKLILRVKDMSLKSQDSSKDTDSKNADSVLEELLKVAKSISYLHMFVEEIDIANLDFKGDRIRILFKNDDFFVDNKSFLLRLNLYKEGENVNADIKNLWVKDHNLSVEGNLSINTKSEFHHLNARATSHLLDFNASVSYKKGQVSYEFTDVNIRAFSRLLNQVREKMVFPEDLFWWLASGAKGEFYHIEYLKGFADIAKENYYLDDIQGLALVQNVEVRLDDHMSPIEFPNLILKLDKQKLDFGFDKANYNGANLDKSSVYLYNIFNENIGINLHIQSENLKFDQKLSEALKPYGLNLPFYQKSGKIKTDFSLRAGLAASNVLEYSGEFDLESATLSLLDLDVNKALVKLKQDDLSIKNANVKNSFLEAAFNADVNLSSKKGVFAARISRLNNELVDMKDQDVDFNLDFSQAVRFSIPKWGLDLNFQKGLELSLSKVSTLVPYSPLFKKFGLEDASNIHYRSENFKDFVLQIDEARFKSDFLISGKSPYESDSFSINGQNDVVKINTTSNFINATLGKQNKEIHLNNLTYVYKKSEESGLKFEEENVVFDGVNAGIILADMNKTLQFDKIQASLKKGILQAKASKNRADFELYYSPSSLKLSAKNMDDGFINIFLQKQAVQGGVFNLSVIGNGLEFFQGRFTLKDTFVKDLKGLNTLVSFIDTVPSLLLFKSPTFNEKGLSLIEGNVIFNRKKDLLGVEAINLSGNSVDIFGLGNANLRLGTLDLDLELKTLKSASEAISKVPVLNYVILGKDQEISTHLKIDGTLEDPKFHTQILTDTLKTPFNLIKNIIQLPMNLLDKKK